jgi:hypothetical protein
MVRSACFKWWAVLGSNQWPLPCETGVRGLRINGMRVQIPIATGTCCHVISLDITQCHDLTVPKLSQRPLLRGGADQIMTPGEVSEWPLSGIQAGLFDRASVWKSHARRDQRIKSLPDAPWHTTQHQTARVLGGGTMCDLVALWGSRCATTVPRK